MYSLIRPLLFQLDAEKSHDLSISLLAKISKSPLLEHGLKQLYTPADANQPVKIMGLDFPNRLGLAAGLDKHGQCINAFAAMGFGFIEAGTVTPLAQPGNAKPRLFRLVQQQAIINRMGFNSVGLDTFIDNFKQHTTQAIVGINLGKNAATPLEKACDDYLIGMQKTYSLADYLAINLSSPNTKQLRELQTGAPFSSLVKQIKLEQTKLCDQHSKYTPVAIKIAPDLEPSDIKEICATCMNYKIDAIIATNTTIDRSGISGDKMAHESGGLSGKPLKDKSTHTIKLLAAELKGSIPIIGVGGISSAQDAIEKIQAGASLVQLYTALIYQGPSLIKKINKGLSDNTPMGA